MHTAIVAILTLVATISAASALQCTRSAEEARRLAAPTTWSCFCDDADGRAQHPAVCAPKPPPPRGAATR